MAERQLHGLQWESHIKKQLNLSSNSYTSHWDGELDGLPLSIKCMGISNALEMSSLLRFWQSPPFLMIVGWWKDTHTKQVEGSQKLFFSEEILGRLRGTLSLEDIQKAVDTLTIKNFPEGRHEEARAWFKQWKKDHSPKAGLLTLTGKVDSKTQRRWQCSINRTNFVKLFGPRRCDPLI
jgi:hypothetical protein